MANVLHRKLRVNDDFDVLKCMTSTKGKEEDKERAKTAKNFEDVGLEALLDENYSQILKQLAEQLGVSQQAVYDQLRGMGKIQKTDRWVPHELNYWQMEMSKNICDILFVRYRRKSFLQCIVTGDEKWIYCEIPSAKNHG